jgi:hypothetical protein
MLRQLFRHGHKQFASLYTALSQDLLALSLPLRELRHRILILWRSGQSERHRCARILGLLPGALDRYVNRRVLKAVLHCVAKQV